MRFAKPKPKVRNLPRRTWLNVGFATTIDCAMLIAAQELGLFRQHGLDVRLSREVGWATIREKLLHEELDAAAAHASMLFSIYCGLGVVRRPCLTGMLLGFNGSAITLSNELWDLGVRGAASLGQVIRERKSNHPLTFGVVLELSSQNYNLRKWLRSGGIDPDKDVRVVVVPSAIVYECYRSGHLDGYCVAEPWNSAAALGNSGWIAAPTSEIEPQHPEKVLLVLQDFAEKREEEHLRMIAALIEAGRYCDEPENRRELARMLARPEYFDVSVELLTNALVGPFETGRGRRAINDFVIYDTLKAGVPTRAKGRWVFDLVRTLGGEQSQTVLRPEMIAKVFREDIFQRAAALCGKYPPPGPPFLESPGAPGVAPLLPALAAPEPPRPAPPPLILCS